MIDQTQGSFTTFLDALDYFRAHASLLISEAETALWEAITSDEVDLKDARTGVVYRWKSRPRRGTRNTMVPVDFSIFEDDMRVLSLRPHRTSERDGIGQDENFRLHLPQARRFAEMKGHAIFDGPSAANLPKQQKHAGGAPFVWDYERLEFLAFRDLSGNLPPRKDAAVKMIIDHMIELLKQDPEEDGSIPRRDQLTAPAAHVFATSIGKGPFRLRKDGRSKRVR
jgi:hypothetical protein